MGSWHQCPGCGDVLPGDDSEATCRCITEPVLHYALTDDERAVALLALATAQELPGFGIEPERIVAAVQALGRHPLVMERVIGIRDSAALAETGGGG